MSTATIQNLIDTKAVIRFSTTLNYNPRVLTGRIVHFDTVSLTIRVTDESGEGSTIDGARHITNVRPSALV